MRGSRDLDSIGVQASIRLKGIPVAGSSLVSSIPLRALEPQESRTQTLIEPGTRFAALNSYFEKRLDLRPERASDFQENCAMMTDKIQPF